MLMAPWQKTLWPEGGQAAPLAAAAEAGLAERFHSWRGRSGRRYVVSVYPAGSAPDYRDAVVLHVARRGGLRRITSLGAVPSAAGDGVDEIHFHLLAQDAGARASVIADLRPAVDVMAVNSGP